jgi:hypothetical protein
VASGSDANDMGRESPDCGEPVRVKVERIRVLAEMPTIASPRWDRASCSWSLSFEPGDARA